MAAQVQVYMGVVTVLDQDPADAAIQMGVLQVMWKDTPYWGVDGKTVWALSGDLSVGELPYAPWILDFLVPYQEQLLFNTKVLQSADRTEQRIAKREGIPHQIFQAESRIEKEDWPDFDAILNKWAKRKWPVPIWAELTKYDGTLASGTTSIAMDTSYANYEEEGYAVVWKSKDEWELVSISTVAAGSLTLASGLSSTYSDYCWIMPCKLSYFMAAPDIENYHDHVKVKVTTIAERPNAITGYVPDQTYDSMAVLTKPSLLNNDYSPQTHNPDIHITDYKTGLFTVVSNSNINEVMQNHFWRQLTKQDCWELRQFFHYVNGRQIPFLVPTFEDDLELVVGTTPSDDTLYVKYTNLTDNMGTYRYRNYVGFFRDGTLLIRKVTAIAKEDPDSDSVIDEALTLDAIVGSSYDAGTKLCWVDKCRVENNEVVFDWISQYYLECNAGLVRVP